MHTLLLNKITWYEANSALTQIKTITTLKKNCRQGYCLRILRRVTSRPSIVL